MDQSLLSFVPLFSSELHLRWTTDDTVLDETALETIDVLAPASAATLFREHMRRARGLQMHRRVPRCASLQLSSLSSDRAMAWVLRTLGKPVAPKPSDAVWVSWSEEHGVRTSWQTFHTHWLSFCREGQDDTIITPADGPWILVHHHQGRFLLGN